MPVKNATQLLVKGKKEYDAEVKRLSSSIGKTMLMEMVSELSKTLPGPYSIVLDGKEAPNPGDYVSDKKHSSYTAADAANFVALFFHSDENMALYWANVPQIHKDLISLLVKQGYLAADDAKVKGFDSIISVAQSRYRYDDPTVTVSGHKVWFCVEISAGESNNYWDKAAYIGLRSEFALKAASSEDLNYRALSKDIPDEWKVECAESEAISSVPLITATLKQGTLKFSRARVTAASSWKFMKSMPIPEILPDFSDFGDKINCGQSFLPLFNGMSEKALNSAPVKVLKSAAERLFKLNEEFLIPMLMPHIKGFKAGILQYRAFNSRTALMEYFKEAESDDWITLEPLIGWLCINSYTLLTKRTVSDMYLEDPIYGGRVTLDRVVEFERSALGSFCTALYCLGMVEVALAPLPKISFDPYTHICAVRLTSLGRYALGFSKTYDAPSFRKEALFELDDKQLIIQSLKPGNAYESLLSDTSVPIGGGRFLMSPESFLKNCRTRADVGDKVEFFHQYVCADPPEIWVDFFKKIERRCNPFVRAKVDYIVYEVDPSDAYLVSLLTSDPILKTIVIRAEGYRILIPNAKSSLFIARLKSFGYLV